MRVVVVTAVLALCLSAPAAAQQLPVLTPPAAPPKTLPDTQQMRTWIRDLVRLGPRRTGSPGGRRAAYYVRDKLRALGVSDAHIEPTPTYSWEAKSYGLRVGGKRIDAYPVQHTGIAGANVPGRIAKRIKAPVVDVGFGTPAEQAVHDVKGKIVVFDLKFLLPLAGLAPFTEFLWDPALSLAEPPSTLISANPYITTFTEAVQAAMDNGAVGFVGVLTDYFDSNRYLNEYYRRTPMTIPGMWVTKAEGARLRALASDDPSAQLTLEARRRKVPARTVVGALPGRTDETIMIQSHHDSVGPGAVEDASGTAEVLALARHYAKVPREQREKTLLFATFDSHFTGYQSHMDFVKRHITEPTGPRRIVANVTLEHIAKQAVVGENGRLVVTDQPEPRGVFENVSAPLKGALVDAIVRHDLRRTAVLNGVPFSASGIGIPTDASFVAVAGVPTISYIAGPVYLYDRADTIDKVDMDELVPVARAFTDVVDAIDATPGAAIAR